MTVNWQPPTRAARHTEGTGQAMKEDNANWYLVVVGISALVCYMWCLSGLFVNPESAIRAATTLGFTDVQVVDRDNFWICFKGGRGDVARFTVQATNPIGNKVRFYVFVGWPFKGCTIRTNS